MSSSVFHKGLSITLAVMMHAALIAMLFIGVPFAREQPHVPSGPQVLAMEAVFMDSAALEQVVARHAEQRAAEEQRDREAAEAAEAAAAAARAQREADEQRAVQQRREREEAEAAEQARLQQLQLEREQEQQRRADEQARRAEAEAEADRQRQEEQRRREAEEARLAEQRAEEEEQRQREEAEQRRREQEQARQQAEAEAELSRMLDAEAARRAAEESGLRDQYMAMIQQRIEQNWIPPASASRGLSCVVHVQQIPSGDVVDVRIGRCNGDDAVRRSIEAAVHRASPLPRPPVPSLFNRNLQLTFEPEV